MASGIPLRVRTVEIRTKNRANDVFKYVNGSLSSTIRLRGQRNDNLTVCIVEIKLCHWYEYSTSIYIGQWRYFLTVFYVNKFLYIVLNYCIGIVFVLQTRRVYIYIFNDVSSGFDKIVVIFVVYYY